MSNPSNDMFDYLTEWVVPALHQKLIKTEEAHYLVETRDEGKSGTFVYITLISHGGAPDWNIVATPGFDGSVARIPWVCYHMDGDTVAHGHSTEVEWTGNVDKDVAIYLQAMTAVVSHVVGKCFDGLEWLNGTEPPYLHPCTKRFNIMTINEGTDYAVVVAHPDDDPEESFASHEAACKEARNLVSVTRRSGARCNWYDHSGHDGQGETCIDCEAFRPKVDGTVHADGWVCSDCTHDRGRANKHVGGAS